MAGSSGWVGKLRQVSGAAPTRDSHSEAPTSISAGVCAALAGCRAEGLGALGCHQGHDGAAVLEEILDGVGLEVRVDHHYDGPDLQDAEQGRHVVGPVGQGDDDALLRSDSGLREHVGIAVGQCLHFTVAHPSGIGVQRAPVSPAFAHPGIEKEVGDVEMRRMFCVHGRICPG